LLLNLRCVEQQTLFEVYKRQKSWKVVLKESERNKFLISVTRMKIGENVFQKFRRQIGDGQAGLPWDLGGRHGVLGILRVDVFKFWNKNNFELEKQNQTSCFVFITTNNNCFLFIKKYFWSSIMEWKKLKIEINMRLLFFSCLCITSNNY